MHAPNVRRVPASDATEEGMPVSTLVIDARGMRCPLPIQELIMHMHETSHGDIIEVTSDCATFEDDVRKWSSRTGHTLLAITRDGEAVKAQIQV